MEKLLHELRSNSWRVAVHNDYHLNGARMSFWLMTHPSGLYLKGEGWTDLEALQQIEEQARRVFAPSP